MKLKAAISGNDHEIQLGLRDGTAAGDVDGRRYDLELRELAEGEYLLLEGSEVYRCRVEQTHDSGSGNTFHVALRGRNYEVALTDPKRLRSGQGSDSHHSGAAEIVSPMPGKIVRVLVKTGDQVKAGAGVIVVEAMKMQNEMKAPKAGTVKSIETEEGATVNAGDVLAVIE